MPLMKRVGCAGVSMRLKVVAAAGPSAFVETNNLPRRVATQSGEAAAGALLIATTYEPALSAP